MAVQRSTLKGKPKAKKPPKPAPPAPAASAKPRAAPSRRPPSPARRGGQGGEAKPSPKPFDRTCLGRGRSRRAELIHEQSTVELPSLPLERRCKVCRLAMTGQTGHEAWNFININLMGGVAIATVHEWVREQKLAISGKSLQRHRDGHLQEWIDNTIRYQSILGVMSWFLGNLDSLDLAEKAIMQNGVLLQSLFLGLGILKPDDAEITDEERSTILQRLQNPAVIGMMAEQRRNALALASIRATKAGVARTDKAVQKAEVEIAMLDDDYSAGALETFMGVLKKLCKPCQAIIRADLGDPTAAQ